MRKITCVAGAVSALLVLAAAPPGAAAGERPKACVTGHVDRCFGTLAEAVARATNGDAVRLGRGAYAGGVTISKSLRIVGAGEGETVIKGGGPVLTVAATANHRPVVQLVDLTITGGDNRGMDLSGEKTGYNAHGGGILVPYSSSDRGAGASLTLRRVTVKGNSVRPSGTLPSPSGAKCPDGDCPYAGAYGGGIASAGSVTLVDVTVANNMAGGTASDANGGGVFSAVGPVTITRTAITGNRAAPKAHEIGRWAQGGGITIGEGSKPTTIANSRIEGNTAQLVTDWPASVEMGAESGGIFMEGNAQLTITESALSGNHVVADAPAGEPMVIGAALHFQYGGDGLLMEDTTITGNTLTARIATTDNVAPIGGFVESDGHAVMKRVTIAGNRQSLHTTAGTAGLSGSLFLCGCDNGDGGVTDLTRVRISGNVSTATSDSGPVWVWGGGIFAVDGTHLRLAASKVTDNRAVAIALDGSSDADVRGGGLWAGPLWGTDPSVDLTGSVVTGNRGTVSPGGSVLGGGLYAEVPVTGTSGVTGNIPDDVYLP